MTDFDKFTKALSEYISASLNCDKETRHKLYLSFTRQILNLFCDDFRLYYHKAVFYTQNMQYAEAKNNIDKALSLLSDIKKNDLEYVENGEYLNGRYENGFVHRISQSLNSQLGELYMCAGEIYARNGLYELSLGHFKKAQYYMSFLKSDFVDDTIALYSFRKFNEYSLMDLINRQITVCPSWMMNDPFDSIINLWADENFMVKGCKDKNLAKAYVQSFKYYRIRSFTCGTDESVLKNILMWSHYAGEHGGYCIKYRFSRNFIKQNPSENFEHMYLKKVSYSDSLMNIDVPTIDSNLAFATKSMEWAYENEVRLVVYNPNAESPFYGINLDVDSHIESIYFGYKCSMDKKNAIRNILKSNSADEISYNEMQLDKHDIYKMKIVKCNF